MQDSNVLSQRIDLTKFYIFTRNVQHDLKKEGIRKFLTNMLQSDTIKKYWENGDCVQAMYLVGMTDYLCNLLELPYCDKYHDIRKVKLKEPLYPESVMLGLIKKDEAEKLVIKEFKAFNIWEVDVFDVC